MTCASAHTRPARPGNLPLSPSQAELFLSCLTSSVVSSDLRVASDSPVHTHLPPHRACVPMRPCVWPSRPAPVLRSPSLPPLPSPTLALSSPRACSHLQFLHLWNLCSSSALLQSEDLGPCPPKQIAPRTSLTPFSVISRGTSWSHGPRAPSEGEAQVLEVRLKAAHGEAKFHAHLLLGLLSEVLNL